jgi:hypothetical protein
VGHSKPPAWSDSERETIDALLKDREFEQQLSTRRAKRWESIKAWAQWVTVVLAAGGVIWDKASLALAFVREHIR